VTGTATYQRIHGSGGADRRPGRPGQATAPSAGGTSISSSGTYDYFSFGASASQLIWDFGQTYDRFKAANRSVDVLPRD